MRMTIKTAVQAILVLAFDFQMKAALAVTLISL